MQVYLGHPHFPREWSTEENTDGLVRRFFRKAMRVTWLSRVLSKRVQVMPNNRSRKILNDRAPPMPLTYCYRRILNAPLTSPSAGCRLSPSSLGTRSQLRWDAA